MKDLISKIEDVMTNHFSSYQVIIDPNDDKVMYKLKLTSRMDVVAITIFPKVIIKVINDNFTIFEKLFYGKKIQNTAVILLASTLYNLINSKSCLQSLADYSKDVILTEFDYEKKKSQLELIISQLATEVVPFKDRNKYLIQPNITVNLNSRLPIILSDIQLMGFMILIGYRPEKTKRRKV